MFGRRRHPHRGHPRVEGARRRGDLHPRCEPRIGEQLVVNGPRRARPRELRGRLVDLFEYQSASSTSPGSASRCRPAGSWTPSTRPSRRPSAPATRSSSRHRCRSAAAGKAGGIKLAATAEEVRLHAGNILGMDIKGHVVKRVRVEHAVRHHGGVRQRELHARPLGQEVPETGRPPAAALTSSRSPRRNPTRS